MINVSVVTVVYNRKELLRETIESVVRQDYSSFEYVVIDGGSTDGSIDIIKDNKSKIAYWQSGMDDGIFDAMNIALKHVRGRYAIFLNAGDRFVDDNVLSRVFSNGDDDEDLIFGDVYIRNELGYKLVKADPIYARKNVSRRNYVFQGQGICHQALFTKSDALRNVGFEKRYALGADYYSTYRVWNEGNHRLRYVGFPISVFDDRYGGASHNRTRGVLRERAIMFGYRRGICFLVYLEKVLLIEFIKKAIAVIFPQRVKSHRAAKYLVEV
jgi:Predicted glycosyltransferases